MNATQNLNLKKQIYYGLGAIKNVGFDAISNVVNERELNGKLSLLMILFLESVRKILISFNLRA